MTILNDGYIQPLMLSRIYIWIYTIEYLYSNYPLGRGKPTKPPKPTSFLNVSDNEDVQFLENFNLNNSTSSC